MNFKAVAVSFLVLSTSTFSNILQLGLVQVASAADRAFVAVNFFAYALTENQPCAMGFWENHHTLRRQTALKSMKSLRTIRQGRLS